MPGPAEIIQASFAKGEISPALYGRVDTALYKSALRTARNVVIRAQGGASQRPGLLYFGPQKEHTYDARLINFEFNTTDTYILEIGNFYMRVIRQGGHVTNTPVAISGITNANPCVVTTTGSHGFGYNSTSADEVFFAGIAGMLRGTLNGLNGRRFNITVLSPTTFSLQDQVTNANIDTSTWTAFSNAGTPTVANIYTLPLPYAIADTLTMEVTQNADVMTLTHPNYPPAQLGRIAHNNWTYTVPTFAPKQPGPASISVVVNNVGSATVRYQVTSTAVGTLEESLPGLNAVTFALTGITNAKPPVVTAPGHNFALGDEIEIDGVGGMTQVNGRRFTCSNPTTNTVTLVSESTTPEDSTNYGTYTSGGTAAQTFVQITTSGVGSTTVTTNETINYAAVPNTQYYSIYLESNGVYGWLGDSTDLTFTNSNLAPNLTISPPMASNPFLFAGNYPATSNFYKQRQVYGGTNNAPDTVIYSQPASPLNMSQSSPPQDSDAITVSMASQQVNAVKHFLVCANDLMIMTSGSEWQCNQGNGSDFSTSTLTQAPQSGWGSHYVPPILINRHVVFVTENGSQVRDLVFSWTAGGVGGGYICTELDILAQHLFANFSIVDWTFAKYPDPIIHIIRADGQVVTLTDNQEQQMLAWTRWDTQGLFTRVTSQRPQLPGPTPQQPLQGTQTGTGNIDEQVVFVVKRQINGHTVRYIEGTANGRFTDVRDCFFVDAGVSFDNPVSITAVSQTSPCRVTAPGHGLTTGQNVDIFGILWAPTFDAMGNANQPGDIDTNNDLLVPYQLNTQRFQATVVDANNITLAQVVGGAAVPVDSTGFVPYVSGGTVRACANTVMNLDHLEGATVVALADGNVYPGLTVTNGAISLPTNALGVPRQFSRAQVGLNFIADLETLNVEGTNSGEELQGARTKIPQVLVRFQASRGLWIGSDNFNLIPMKQREFENLGDPTALLTGDKVVILDPTWNSNGRIFLRQPYPLPMTILDVIPDVVVGSI